MTKGAAERFAKTMLEQFGSEGSFQFELPSGHNIELVAAALQNMGCKVAYSEESNLVRVKVVETEKA